MSDDSPSRRAFLRAAVASAIAAPSLASCAGSRSATQRWTAGNLASPGVASPTPPRRWANGDPFSLGVASGDPTPDGFVLWTRLAPQPLFPDPAMPGGMSGGAVEINYEIATDPGMRDIVRRGSALADPAYAYSVHADVAGLLPGRPYWYRFTSFDAASRIGRAVTLPARDSRPEHLRFGFVSCSNYEHGYFAAYRHLADEHPDLVLFLGDYIYEYVDTHTGTVRRHSGNVEAATLPTYRDRYAQYRLDPDLARLHQETTALMTWDDHEVQNDYADYWSQDFADPARFLLRRAAAYRAFYEHMPVRAVKHPTGPAMKIYDRFAVGDLAEIAMIDGRQYRSREACYRRPKKGGGHVETFQSCPELRLDSRSMIGQEQERWLYDGLAHSTARWNVIAQDVLMAELREKIPSGEIGFWTDDWNGYPANRQRLLRHIHDSGVANPVVLGGDIHSFWTNDLKLDFADPRSPVVATEFVGTSISAHGPSYKKFRSYLPDNPHVRFFESRKRGYAIVDLDRKRMVTRFRALSNAQHPDATVSTLRSFTVEDGRKGAQV
jgi:alkaline phosphatase D